MAVELAYSKTPANVRAFFSDDGLEEARDVVAFFDGKDHLLEYLAPLGLNTASTDETVRSVLIMLSPPSSWRSGFVRSTSVAPLSPLQAPAAVLQVSPGFGSN